MYTMEQIWITMENLKRNNMDALYLSTKAELVDVLKHYMQDGDRVTFSDSITLAETGVLDYIKRLDDEGGIQLLDCNAPNNPAEEADQIYGDAFRSDLYLTSCNAITQNGYLYNVDGNSNRIVSMILGPKTVVVIVGANKLATTKEEAMERVRRIASSKNGRGLYNSLCMKTGEGTNCVAEERVCCNYTFFGKQCRAERIKVIIIGEEYSC